MKGGLNLIVGVCLLIFFLIGIAIGSISDIRLIILDTVLAALNIGIFLGKNDD